jgi:KaiC/GvpD/RAD55 family RecA-like ATPase
MGSVDGCLELLSAATAETTVLWVTYSRSPSDCLERYRESGGAGSLSVIAVGDMPTDTPRDSAVTVKSVSTPDDLTGLGITLSQALSTHDDAIVCFDSLTVLLQYVDTETAYEFLNAVTGHLYAADARAHFHLDPSAHDSQTVDALASLFDVIVDRDDGEWSVRRRRLLRAE